MSETKRIKVDSTMVKVCTHSGSFHADESLAVFMLKLLPQYKDSELIRSRNPADWEASDVVIDVGGQYDGKKWFDHHQREFNETFSGEFNTKLSSAGLIYKHFGREIISQVLGIEGDLVELLYKKMYKEFIEALDANDNGISNYPAEVEGEKKFNDKNISLPSIVSGLNPSWNTNPTDKDFDEAFKSSSLLIGQVFLNLLNGYGKSWLPAKDIVQRAFDARYETHESGHIIVLGGFCPWKEHLYAVEKEAGNQGETKFVLFQDSSNKWRVSTVPISSTSFDFRLGLLEEWRGLRDEELSKVSGVPGCVFVHAAGFIGGAESKEAVLELAKLSLKQ